MVRVLRPAGCLKAACPGDCPSVAGTVLGGYAVSREELSLKGWPVGMSWLLPVWQVPVQALMGPPAAARERLRALVV